MKIGPYNLSSIDTGTIWLDGGAMFGTVPRVLWEKPHPPDNKNRIRLAMRALLIEGEGRRILVDCGAGDKGGARFDEMFGLDRSTDHLGQSLKKRNITQEDITDVILTHLHFDHAGGGTTKQSDGTHQASFPNAVYHLQKRNLAVAQKPNARERASYLVETYQALLEEERLRLIDGPGNLFPGIDLYVSEGHTEAQQHPVVFDGKVKLFYGGDLIPTPVHLPLPWVAGFDLHPLTILKEKEEILAPAVEDGTIVFYEHDPNIPATTIQRGKRHFEAGTTVTL